MSETMTADEVIDDARENLDCEDDVTCCEENQEETSSEVEEVASEETESEPEEKPPLTIDELEHLHYESIRVLNIKVREAGCDYDAAKAESNREKKRFEGLSSQLSDLIQEDPKQRRLPFSDNSQSEVAGESAAQPSDEWKQLPVSELGIAKGITAKLEENDLRTLGELQGYWNSGKDLKDLNGIAEGKAAAVADAFADYGTTHPELFGEAAEAAGPADALAEVLQRSIDVLNLKKKHHASMLAEGFETLGHLASFLDSSDDLEGIGEIDKRGSDVIIAALDGYIKEQGVGEEEDSPAQEAAE